jgi:excisionase family DNA binding protein
MKTTKPQLEPLRMLTGAEVCQYLGISPSHLAELRATKKITAYRIGRGFQFTPSDIEKYLEQQKEQ